MSEGTNIGAATPVELGKDLDSKDLRSKAVNDLVALVEGLATARHRNSQLFAKMVSEASSFPASEAKEKGLIDGVTNSSKELWQALNNRTIEIQGKKFTLEAQDPVITKFEMDFGQKLLNILANPQLAYILFILGTALLYFEMQPWWFSGRQYRSYFSAVCRYWFSGPARQLGWHGAYFA